MSSQIHQLPSYSWPLSLIFSYPQWLYECVNTYTLYVTSIGYLFVGSLITMKEPWQWKHRAGSDGTMSHYIALCYVLLLCWAMCHRDCLLMCTCSCVCVRGHVRVCVSVYVCVCESVCVCEIVSTCAWTCACAQVLPNSIMHIGHCVWHWCGDVICSCIQ